MNNSFIAQNALELEEKRDITPTLRAEEAKLIKIIQSVELISESPEWLTLKELVFDGVVESLERQKSAETNKQPINTDIVHSLNGQLAWAKRYSNFSTLAHAYRLQLRKVKETLNARSKA